MARLLSAFNLAFPLGLLQAGYAMQTIRQSTAFATAGTPYCTSLGEFIDVNLVTRIDSNSRSLLCARSKAGVPAGWRAQGPPRAARRCAPQSRTQDGKDSFERSSARRCFESLNSLAKSETRLREGPRSRVSGKRSTT